MVITDKKVIQKVKNSFIKSGEMPPLFETVYLVHDCLLNKGDLIVTMIPVFFDGRNLRGETQVYGHPEEIAGNMIFATTLHYIISKQRITE